MNGAASAAAKQAAEARWREGKREPRAKRQRAAGA
jgi:hypothetical protein